MNAPKVTDLTVEALQILIRNTVREVIKEELASQNEISPTQHSLLDIPPLSVGEWPEGLQLLSREEYYDDNDR